MCMGPIGSGGGGGEGNGVIMKQTGYSWENIEYVVKFLRNLL